MNSEAQRCLLCKKAMCSLKGCPVNTDVPSCMALYKEGKLQEAGELLFRNNPMTAVTSRICNWKRFCYGNCILNAKNIPVRWYEIEQEISEEYLKSANIPVPELPVSKRVAVIGGGPAGISAAILLRMEGIDVTIYESNARLGGVLRYGIPEFRLKKSFVDRYEEILAEAGVNVVCGVKVQDASVLAKEYDAVIVCAGATLPLKLRIPGDEKAVQALEYLKAPAEYPVGKAIVIGGGNVAMDAARTAVRQGCETWIYYRKTFENMPANPDEVEDAKADGVKFACFEAPVKLEESFVTFRKCENYVENGKLLTRILDGTEHDVQCDILISAISERPDLSIVGASSPLADAGDGLITEGSNIFVAGDYILGPSTVVQAVASAKRAVNGVLKKIL